MKHTLHIAALGTELHLGLSETADPAETLALCDEALRNERIVEFPDFLPPGAVQRSTVVVNFAHVVCVWVSADA